MSVYHWVRRYVPIRASKRSPLFLSGTLEPTHAPTPLIAVASAIRHDNSCVSSRVRCFPGSRYILQSCQISHNPHDGSALLPLHLSPPQGHLELFICNADELDDPDGVPVQSCFNKYPLTRASDDGDASPIDPKYPGRYYIDPPCRQYETDQTKPPGSEPGPIVTARYMLPAKLTCKRCIVQMIYCEFGAWTSANAQIPAFACRF